MKSRRRLVVMVAIVGVIFAGGCSRGDGVHSDAGKFCTAGRDNQALIVSPPLANPEQIEATLEFYRLMGELAPVDIAEEWNDLIVAMETAKEVIPGNQESEQKVAQTAYASERSAYAVMEWFRDRCNVHLPITTIVPHQ